MTGFDLPEECTVCGASCGWYIEEDIGVYVSSDGEVKLRTDNTRYGYKVEAKCNNPDCDAIVNIYLDVEAVNNGEIESTSAKEIIERAKDNDLLPNAVKVECEECGKEFLDEPEFQIAGDGGINILANVNCGCDSIKSLISETIEHIPPEDLEGKKELIPPKSGDDKDE